MKKVVMIVGGILMVALAVGSGVMSGAIPLPFGDGDAEPEQPVVVAVEEPDVKELEEPEVPENPEEPGPLPPPVLLRVFRNEAGQVEALFDRPVRVVGGEVKLVTSKGALGRKLGPDPGAYGYSIIFDINSMEEGGDVTATSIKAMDGARIVDEDESMAILDFMPQAFTVEKRLFGSSVVGNRPYVREVRAEEWSVRVYFSTDVRFSENLRLTARNTAGQMGELRLAWESLNAMRNWSFVDNLLFEVPEPYRTEAFWLTPVQVYGFSEGDALTDAAEGGLPARRSLQPFAVDLSRGAILNDLQRCAYYLSDGDQMRYSFAVSNLQQFVSEDPRLSEAMARNECMRALSRTSAAGDTGLNRNWKYSVCVDSLEIGYRVGEFYPGELGGGYPSELRDRWLVADDLVSRPYDLLSLDERVDLRGMLTHESCPLFYPQLFYGYWMQVE